MLEPALTVRIVAVGLCLCSAVAGAPHGRFVRRGERANIRRLQEMSE